MIRGIVFDLDGTLVDSYEAIADALNHARARHALPPLPLPEVRRHVGRGLEALIAEQVNAEHVTQGVADFRSRYAAVFRRKTRILPSVASTLDELSAAGYRMSVASNKPARFGTRILDALGIAQHFDAVLGPDISGTTKPEPTMLRMSMERMECTAATTAYVGDMVLDVETASRAGVPVVLVPGGSSDAAALAATGAPVLDGIQGLPAWLRGFRSRLR